MAVVGQYIETTSVLDNISSLEILHFSNRPICVLGPRNSGKKSLVKKLAAIHQKKTYKISCNELLEFKVLLGSYICTDIPGEFLWQEGLVTRACRLGHWLCLEDINLCPLEVLQALTSIFQNETLFVSGLNESIRLHTEFRLFATCSSTGNSFASLEDWLVFPIKVYSPQDCKEIIDGLFPMLIPLNYILLSFFVSLKYNDEECLPLIDIIRICRRLIRQGKILSNPLNFEDRKTIFFAIAQVVSSGYETKLEKNALHIAAADYLTLPADECLRYLEEIYPLFEETDDYVRIGTAEYKKFSEGKAVENKSIQGSNFISTPYNMRTLEQILISIELHEPVLLIGETGIGKTYIVQHIASILRAELFVVNLHYNSEAAELLGGYRPCSVFELLRPIIEEFKVILHKLYSESKTEQIFERIEILRRKNHWRLISNLIKKTLEVSAQKLLEKPNKRANSNAALENLLSKVSRLHYRLITDQDKPSKIFVFSEGVLTKAFREGHWLLLDEINLAGSELLEVLIPIIASPTDPLVLFDKGNFEEIPRHPNFRFFGCMNPGNDVGKRALPPGIRRHFSEKNIDSIADHPEDLKLYLQGTIKSQLSLLETISSRPFTIDDSGRGPHMDDQKTAVQLVFSIHNEIRSAIDDLLLVDGAGHKPLFSLRSLSRCLKVAFYYCRYFSFTRSLIEGLHSIFTCQLNFSSKPVFTELIFNVVHNQQRLDISLNGRITQENFSSSLKSTISVQNFIQILPGYFIDRGPLSPSNPSTFVVTSTVESHLESILRCLASCRFPLLLQGHTSAGKSSLIEYIGQRSGHRVMRINNHEHTDVQEYLGSYGYNHLGEITWMPGLLVRSLQAGHWLILDELNLAPSDVLESLNRLLDDNEELFIAETQTHIRPHPNFRLFATQNPSMDAYGGRKVLSRAFRNRFIEVSINDITQPEIEIILSKRYSSKLPSSFCSRLSHVYSALSEIRSSENVFSGRLVGGLMTLRDLFRWANRNPCDTYQNLAEHGYCLLAERLRSPVDKILVKNILEAAFKVSIDASKIYNQSILSKNEMHAKGLIWTSGVQRMVHLIKQCIQNNEPVLLIGETGIGKTTICEWIADNMGYSLQTLSCHQYTEASDFVGMFRPSRQNVISDELNFLMDTFHEKDPKRIKAVPPPDVHFEWSDGILLLCMKQGQFLLIDEISLAEDAVLERLNSVLEPGRTLTVPEIIEHDGHFHAAPGFQIFATMNPGGDFGKRELSPALRSRFTEIWVPPLNELGDLLLIIQGFMRQANISSSLNGKLDMAMLIFVEWYMTVLLCQSSGHDIAKELALIQSQCNNYHKFITLNSTLLSISLRDFQSWTRFIGVMTGKCNDSYLVGDVFIEGASCTLLDGLGFLGPFSTSPALLRESSAKCGIALRLLVAEYKLPLANFFDKELSFRHDEFSFGIFPYLLESMKEASSYLKHYSFESATVRENTRRILRALQLSKPILLEGNPGVGKTSIISSLAAVTGHILTRINLSEQTDISDLFGLDVPVLSSLASQAGSSRSLQFAWRDGPFLTALKYGHWILLDEINLASQQVLEGLNAALDHRGTLFIPELGKTFILQKNKTLLFATQNPKSQGGGRKGLPSSFLNRFTKVYMQPLESEDAIVIATSNKDDNYPYVRAIIRSIYHLNEQVILGKLGHAGMPWDLNIRDMRRCMTLFEKISKSSTFEPNIALILAFTNTVSCRFRSIKDQEVSSNTFSRILTENNIPSAEISAPFCWMSDEGLHFRTGIVWRAPFLRFIPNEYILQNAHVAGLESLVLAIHQQSKLILLTGDAGSGKQNLITWLSGIAGHVVKYITLGPTTDTSDLLGGYEQSSLIKGSGASQHQVLACFVQIWDDFRRRMGVSVSSESNYDFSQLATQFSEWIASVPVPMKETHIYNLLIDSWNTLQVEMTRDSKNALHCDSGRFVWVDGMLLKALRLGYWLILDHANSCPASVLDRLNILFEEGLGENKSFDVFEKSQVDELTTSSYLIHPEFRVFLLMDTSPAGRQQNELSRAMRNRATEIFLPSACSLNRKLDSERTIASHGLPVSMLSEFVQSLQSVHRQSKFLLLIRKAITRMSLEDSITFSVSLLDCPPPQNNIEYDSLLHSLRPFLQEFSFLSMRDTREAVYRLSLYLLRESPVVDPRLLFFHLSTTDRIARQWEFDLKLVFNGISNFRAYLLPDLRKKWINEPKLLELFDLLPNENNFPKEALAPLFLLALPKHIIGEPYYYYLKLSAILCPSYPLEVSVERLKIIWRIWQSLCSPYLYNNNIDWRVLNNEILNINSIKLESENFLRDASTLDYDRTGNILTAELHHINEALLDTIELEGGKHWKDLYFNQMHNRSFSGIGSVSEGGLILLQSMYHCCLLIEIQIVLSGSWSVLKYLQDLIVPLALALPSGHVHRQLSQHISRQLLVNHAEKYPRVCFHEIPASLVLSYLISWFSQFLIFSPKNPFSLNNELSNCISYLLKIYNIITIGQLEGFYELSEVLRKILVVGADLIPKAETLESDLLRFISEYSLRYITFSIEKTSTSWLEVGQDILHMFYPMLPFDPANIDYSSNLYKKETLRIDQELSKLQQIFNILYFQTGSNMNVLYSSNKYCEKECEILNAVPRPAEFPMVLLQAFNQFMKYHISHKDEINPFALERVDNLISIMKGDPSLQIYRDLTAPLLLGLYCIRISLMESCSSSAKGQLSLYAVSPASDVMITTAIVCPTVSISAGLLDLLVNLPSSGYQIANLFSNHNNQPVYSLLDKYLRIRLQTTFDCNSHENLARLPCAILDNIRFSRNLISFIDLLTKRTSAYANDSAVNIYRGTIDYCVLAVLPILKSIHYGSALLLETFPEHSVLHRIVSQIEYVVHHLVHSTTALSILMSALDKLLEALSEWEQISVMEHSLKNILSDFIGTLILLRRIELSQSSKLLHLVHLEHIEEHGELNTLFRFLLQAAATFAGKISYESAPSEVVFRKSSEIFAALDKALLGCSVGSFKSRLEVLQLAATLLQYRLLPEVSLNSKTVPTSSLSIFVGLLQRLASHHSITAKYLTSWIEKEQNSLESSLTDFAKVMKWNDTNNLALKVASEKSHRTMNKYINKWKRDVLEISMSTWMQENKIKLQNTYMLFKESGKDLPLEKCSHELGISIKSLFDAFAKPINSTENFRSDSQPKPGRLIRAEQIIQSWRSTQYGEYPHQLSQWTEDLSRHWYELSKETSQLGILLNQNQQNLSKVGGHISLQISSEKLLLRDQTLFSQMGHLRGKKERVLLDYIEYIRDIGLFQRPSTQFGIYSTGNDSHITQFSHLNIQTLNLGDILCFYDCPLSTPLGKSAYERSGLSEAFHTLLHLLPQVRQAYLEASGIQSNCYIGSGQRQKLMEALFGCLNWLLFLRERLKKIQQVRDKLIALRLSLQTFLYDPNVTRGPEKCSKGQKLVQSPYPNHLNFSDKEHSIGDYFIVNEEVFECLEIIQHRLAHDIINNYPSSLLVKLSQLEPKLEHFKDLDLLDKIEYPERKFSDFIYQLFTRLQLGCNVINSTQMAHLKSSKFGTNSALDSILFSRISNPFNDSNSCKSEESLPGNFRFPDSIELPFLLPIQDCQRRINIPLTHALQDLRAKNEKTDHDGNINYSHSNEVTIQSCMLLVADLLSQIDRGISSIPQEISNNQEANLQLLSYVYLYEEVFAVWIENYILNWFCQLLYLLHFQIQFTLDLFQGDECSSYLRSSINSNISATSSFSELADTNSSIGPGPFGMDDVSSRDILDNAKNVSSEITSQEQVEGLQSKSEGGYHSLQDDAIGSASSDLSDNTNRIEQLQDRPTEVDSVDIGLDYNGVSTPVNQENAFQNVNMVNLASEDEIIEKATTDQITSSLTKNYNNQSDLSQDFKNNYPDLIDSVNSNFTVENSQELDPSLWEDSATNIHESHPPISLRKMANAHKPQNIKKKADNNRYDPQSTIKNALEAYAPISDTHGAEYATSSYDSALDSNEVYFPLGEEEEALEDKKDLNVKDGDLDFLDPLWLDESEQSLDKNPENDDLVKNVSIEHDRDAGLTLNGEQNQQSNQNEHSQLSKPLIEIDEGVISPVKDDDLISSEEVLGDFTNFSLEQNSLSNNETDVEPEKKPSIQINRTGNKRRRSCNTNISISSSFIPSEVNQSNGIGANNSQDLSTVLSSGSSFAGKQEDPTLGNTQFLQDHPAVDGISGGEVTFSGSELIINNDTKPFVNELPTSIFSDYTSRQPQENADSSFSNWKKEMISKQLPLQNEAAIHPEPATLHDQKMWKKISKDSIGPERLTSIENALDQDHKDNSQASLSNIQAWEYASSSYPKDSDIPNDPLIFHALLPIDENEHCISRTVDPLLQLFNRPKDEGKDDFENPPISSSNLPSLSTLPLDLHALNGITDSTAFTGAVQHLWSQYNHSTFEASLHLTEQLRIILEPTLAGKLEGDYKSGKRLNMRRILPYIASGYRKDKIWMRRTKSSKRNYQVLISIDQSQSMTAMSCDTPSLAFHSLALLSQALSRLEIGQLAVSAFGESCSLLHQFHEDWNDAAGQRILSSMSFDEKTTNLTALLSSCSEWLQEAANRYQKNSTASSTNSSVVSQIHFVLTDGVFDKLQNSKKLILESLQKGIFTVFLILDARPFQDSILEMKSVSYTTDPITGKSSLQMSRYLDSFPSDYYIILKDIAHLPALLSAALMQWMELLKSKKIDL